MQRAGMKRWVTSSQLPEGGLGPLFAASSDVEMLREDRQHCVLVLVSTNTSASL